MMAAKKGDENMVKFLMDFEKDILEQKGEEEKTPLMFAVESDENWPVIEVLLKKGANLNHTNAKNMTPFMHAAAVGSKEIVKLFITNYPTIMETMDIYGNTALIHATISGNYLIVKFLIEQGANVRH